MTWVTDLHCYILIFCQNSVFTKSYSKMQTNVIEISGYDLHICTFNCQSSILLPLFILSRTCRANQISQSMEFWIDCYNLVSLAFGKICEKQL